MLYKMPYRILIFYKIQKSYFWKPNKKNNKLVDKKNNKSNETELKKVFHVRN